jgi:hypothetical protein
MSPALGVSTTLTTTPTVNDAQQPSEDVPCGKVNVTQNIDLSAPVTAYSNGTLPVSIINYQT